MYTKLRITSPKILLIFNMLSNNIINPNMSELQTLYGISKRTKAKLVLSAFSLGYMPDEEKYEKCLPES